MDDVFSRMSEILKKRENTGAYRTLQTKNRLIDFSSNDYLGLSEKLSELFLNESRRARLPAGSTGSRLLSGNSALTEEVEVMVAAYHKGESGLVFNSGYDANLGLLSTLPGKNDTILYDSLCHASIRDGIRLGNARSFSFKHNDLGDLQKKIHACRGTVFVITESLFSMDGDIAPLKELVDLCREKGFYLIIDEAHATGVYGDNGEGIVCSLGLEKEVFARVHTFGKAIGVHGAIITGPEILREFLINFCRPFIYSTAMPPHSLALIKAAYGLLPGLKHEREKIFSLHNSLKKKLSSLPKIDFQGNGPVNCIMVPGNDKVKKLSGYLKEKGCDARAVLHPSVPAGKERIRVCLHSFNKEEELEILTDAIWEFKEREGWKEYSLQE